MRTIGIPDDQTALLPPMVAEGIPGLSLGPQMPNRDNAQGPAVVIDSGDGPRLTGECRGHPPIPRGL
jgi:hypothetical protein